MSTQSSSVGQPSHRRYFCSGDDSDSGDDSNSRDFIAAQTATDAQYESGESTSSSHESGFPVQTSSHDMAQYNAKASISLTYSDSFDDVKTPLQRRLLDRFLSSADTVVSTPPDTSLKITGASRKSTDYSMAFDSEDFEASQTRKSSSQQQSTANKQKANQQIRDSDDLSDLSSEDISKDDAYSNTSDGEECDSFAEWEAQHRRALEQQRSEYYSRQALSSGKKPVDSESLEGTQKSRSLQPSQQPHRTIPTNSNQIDDEPLAHIVVKGAPTQAASSTIAAPPRMNVSAKVMKTDAQQSSKSVSLHAQDPISSQSHMRVNYKSMGNPPAEVIDRVAQLDGWGPWEQPPKYAQSSSNPQGRTVPLSTAVSRGSPSPPPFAPSTRSANSSLRSSSPQSNSSSMQPQGEQPDTTQDLISMALSLTLSEKREKEARKSLEARSRNAEIERLKAVYLNPQGKDKQTNKAPGLQSSKAGLSSMKRAPSVDSITHRRPAWDSSITTGMVSDGPKKVPTKTVQTSRSVKSTIDNKLNEYTLRRLEESKKKTKSQSVQDLPWNDPKKIASRKPVVDNQPPHSHRK
eukprot:TRINITY_DN4386_c1_g1_i1.p1 TRINITY_DN4386_c1_g1~~TRINITY_DN4386_c1_g1_i1.p1  ORF type:complete len:576 (+),score=122.58 TRINITY_DN4386_c1_g1_i1:183-1910(+)